MYLNIFAFWMEPSFALDGVYDSGEWRANAATGLGGFMQCGGGVHRPSSNRGDFPFYEQ